MWSFGSGSVNHINCARPVLSVPQNDQVGRTHFPAKGRWLKTRSPRTRLNENRLTSWARVSPDDKSFRRHTQNERAETEALMRSSDHSAVPLRILCCAFIGTVNMIFLWSNIASQRWLLWILGPSMGFVGRPRMEFIIHLKWLKILLSGNTVCANPNCPKWALVCAHIRTQTLTSDLNKYFRCILFTYKATLPVKRLGKTTSVSARDAQ